MVAILIQSRDLLIMGGLGIFDLEVLGHSLLGGCMSLVGIIALPDDESGRNPFRGLYASRALRKGHAEVLKIPEDGPQRTKELHPQDEIELAQGDAEAVNSKLLRAYCRVTPSWHTVAVSHQHPHVRRGGCGQLQASALGRRAAHHPRPPPPRRLGCRRRDSRLIPSRRDADIRGHG